MHREPETPEVARRSLLRLGAAGPAGGVASLGLAGGVASAGPPGAARPAAAPSAVARLPRRYLRLLDRSAPADRWLAAPFPFPT